ncbi:thioester dehydrase [Shewanella sp. D64]|uniref:ApeI family dehydratase n=1 Tax=unclassified Shewanella TaxID=196818 RepID=UPI0022BA6AFE|nr:MULTISPECIES: thioester dehydrase [unclassified Shewanella]MEC4726853.1 thioester dehydrase [Shewanella sp. D64]MEC4739035.1 thioester dehydrase [Shewanella sp. E94]WBJ95894.1 thioester dehydrase [Shewanella sp. MTB7]
MIKSCLPRILSSQIMEETIEWRLFIDAELPFFNGHFPEQAVLPGVTQLDWAIRMGCEHFGYPSEVASLEVLKFQQLMLPDSEVTLRVTLNSAKNKLVFSYFNGDKRFGSGRIALGDTSLASSEAS